MQSRNRALVEQTNKCCRWQIASKQQQWITCYASYKELMTGLQHLWAICGHEVQGLLHTLPHPIVHELHIHMACVHQSSNNDTSYGGGSHKQVSDHLSLGAQ